MSAIKRISNVLKNGAADKAQVQPERTPRLIVHVGQMKTGTTTLQHHFSGMSGRLKEQGFFYPPSDLPSSAHHELTAVLATSKDSPGFAAALAGGQVAAQDAGKALIERTKEWLNQNPTGTAILSTETICAWNNVAIANPLKSLIEDIAGDNYLVVAYVRSPVAGAMSRVQQSIYNQTFLRPPVGMLQMPQLHAFADLFKDRFKIRLFDRNHLIGGDIVTDFYKTFLPDVADLTGSVAPTPLNRSLSSEAMIVMQDVKLHISPDGAPIVTDETNLLFQKIRHADLAVGGYRPAKIKSELIEPLTRLQTDVLDLRDRFGITFADIDYSIVGTECDLDLDTLRHARKIAQFDPDRLDRLIKFVLEDGEKVRRMVALIESATGRETSQSKPDLPVKKRDHSFLQLGNVFGRAR